MELQQKKKGEYVSVPSLMPTVIHIFKNFTKISAFEKIKNIMIQKKKCRSGSIRRCLYDYEGDEKDAENDNLEMFIIHFISKLSPIIYKRI